MWQIIWEFRVAEEHRSEFERCYAAEGDWSQLFARSPEFLGTTLLRDPAVPGRYLTLDRWTEAAAFERFQEQYAVEYKALDQHCEFLTEYELKIGAFEPV